MEELGTHFAADLGVWGKEKAGLETNARVDVGAIFCRAAVGRQLEGCV